MSAQPGGAVFDREVALARVDGDADLLKEIAVLFLEEYPGSLKELRDAIACGDVQQAERTAHALKGSVSNFGSLAALEVAREIEDLGRSGKLAEMTPLLDHLELALGALRLELERL